MSKKDVIKIIQDNTATLRAYSVRRLGIFGSFATSSQNTGSDIDILVEFERENKTFDNYMELKLFLERLFNRRVDLVIKDALKTRIKNRILSETVYVRL